VVKQKRPFRSCNQLLRLRRFSAQDILASATLPELGFDALKIDRSFVKDLIERPETKAIVRSLVTLAQDLGMRGIAEGIETPEQLKLVKKMGENEAQGYLLGRPTPDPVVMLRADLALAQNNNVESCASPKYRSAVESSIYMIHLI